MSLPVTIITNAKDVARALGKAAEDQIPFASALTLTRLAILSQLKVRGGLHSKFRLRSGWTAGGIRTRPANKADWPHQSSAVGSRDDYMVGQEEGETKKPRAAGSLALPGRVAAKDLRGAGGRIPKSRRPKGLKRKPRYFLQRMKTGRSAGQEILFHRLTAERYPLRVVYIFRGKAKVEPRLRMLVDVEATVQKHYGAVLTRALNQALADAKVKNAKR